MKHLQKPKAWLLASLTVFILHSSSFISESVAQLTLGSGVVNSYRPVSAVSGATITLSGAQTGVAHTLAAGERVLLVQMTGWTYQNGGKFEYATVASSTGTSVTLTAPTTRIYSPATEKVQLVWVPSDPTGIIVPAGGIVAKKWDGTTGGIVSVLTSGTLTLNGTINANGAGFRYSDGVNTINGNDIYYGGGGASYNYGGGGGGGGYGVPGKPGLSPTGNGIAGNLSGGLPYLINSYGGGGGGAGVGGAGSGGGTGFHGSAGGGGAGYSTGGPGGTSSDTQAAGGLGSSGNGDTDGSVTPLNDPKVYAGYYTSGGGGGNRYVGGGGGGTTIGYSATTGGKAGSNGGAGGSGVPYANHGGGNGGGYVAAAYNTYQYCNEFFVCPDARVWMAGAGQTTTQGGGIVLINAATIVANTKTISADGDPGVLLSTFAAGGGGGGGGGGMLVVNTQNVTSGPLTLCAKGGKGAQGASDPSHGGGGGGTGGGGLVWIQDPLGGVGRNNQTGMPPVVPSLSFCIDGGPMAIIAANPKNAAFSGVGGEGGDGSIQANNLCAVFGTETCPCPAGKVAPVPR